jgi:hypothetical protein
VKCVYVCTHADDALLSNRHAFHTFVALLVGVTLCFCFCPLRHV